MMLNIQHLISQRTFNINILIIVAYFSVSYHCAILNYIIFFGRIMQKQHLFRLTQPCRPQRNGHSSASFLSNSLLFTPVQSSPKQSQLKYRYLHRLDVESIDKKYQLLERLNRITLKEGDSSPGHVPSHQDREKQYSIQSYYIFNEGDQIERRNQSHRNTLLRKRGNENIHLKALSTAEMLRHQLKEHRQFIEKFKPKRSQGNPLTKKFRVNRNSHIRMSQPF